jgi:Tol biopolymer transport system component
MASRSQSPKWSPTASTSRSCRIDRAATRSGSRIRKARSPKKITDLDNEKNAPIWSPDSKSLLYIAGGKQLYNYSVDDGKTTS